MKSKFCMAQWIFLLTLNALPFTLDVVFYKLGNMDNLFWFLPVCISLSNLNYRKSTNTLPYTLLQALMLSFIVISCAVSTYLYYHTISNDFITKVIGEAFLFFESATCMIASAIGIIRKAKKANSGNQ